MSYLDLIDQNAGSHHSESPLVSQRQFCLSQAVAATRATLLLAMAIRIEDAAIGISLFFNSFNVSIYEIRPSAGTAGCGQLHDDDLTVCLSTLTSGAGVKLFFIRFSGANDEIRKTSKAPLLANQSPANCAKHFNEHDIQFAA